LLRVKRLTIATAQWQLGLLAICSVQVTPGVSYSLLVNSLAGFSIWSTMYELLLLPSLMVRKILVPLAQALRHSMKALSRICLAWLTSMSALEKICRVWSRLTLTASRVRSALVVWTVLATEPWHTIPPLTSGRKR